MSCTHHSAVSHCRSFANFQWHPTGIYSHSSIFEIVFSIYGILNFCDSTWYFFGRRTSSISYSVHNHKGSEIISRILSNTTSLIDHLDGHLPAAVASACMNSCQSRAVRNSFITDECSLSNESGLREFYWIRARLF